MNLLAIIDLVNNIGLLLALGLVYDMLGYRVRGSEPSLQQVLAGIILGAIGITLMATPWEFLPGLFFDARSVLLGISGFFFGLIPTLFAVLMAGVYRFYIGGTGVWPGVAVIFTSGAIGFAWRHLRSQKINKITIKELYILGLIIHLNMLFWMLTLPKPLAYTVVRQVALPVMIVLPAGTALLGWLMVNRLVYRHSITALGQKEEQYRLLSENIEAILWEFDIAKNCWTYVAPQVERMLGYSPEEFLDIQFWIDHIDERDRDWASTYCAEAVQRGMSHTFEYRFLKKHGGFVWLRDIVHVELDGADPIKMRGLMIDITERKEAEDALQENEERYRSLFENAPIGILSVDKEGKILEINESFLIILGSPSIEVTKKINILSFIPLVDAGISSAVARCFETGEQISAEVSYKSKWGRSIYAHYRINPNLINNEDVASVLLLIEDITERVLTERKSQEVNEQLQEKISKIEKLKTSLEEQAIRDPLTGLFNRRYLDKAIQQELARSTRQGGSFSLVILDLDSLKKINDTYGHVRGGDQALKVLADTLVEMCRIEDTVCRYAGDEFLIILYNTPALVAHERVRVWKDIISKIKIKSDKGEFTITFSAGLSEFPKHGRTGEELLICADQALYRAKKLGRDRIVDFE